MCAASGTGLEGVCGSGGQDEGCDSCGESERAGFPLLACGEGEKLKQVEMRMEGNPLTLAIRCGCLKGKDRGNLVVLRKAFDPAWLVGACGHCGKKHIRRAI